jgi:hypothetical protein
VASILGAGGKAQILKRKFKIEILKVDICSGFVDLLWYVGTNGHILKMLVSKYGTGLMLIYER